MTVGELIGELKKQDQNKKVVMYDDVCGDDLEIMSMFDYHENICLSFDE